MDLNEYFNSNPVIVDLSSEDRWNAIDELIRHLVANQKISAQHEGDIRAAIKKRESSMSTGLGFGIGLPHASTGLVSDLTVAFGRSRKGIQFDAIDGKPVHMVMLFLVPAGEFQKHLDTLANMAKLLHQDDFRNGLWRRFGL